MKIIKSFLLIGLCLALAAPALAQMGPGGGGMGRGMGPGGGMGRMMYNPQTVTTIKGMLQGQATATGGRGMGMGAWTVKTDQGDLSVHLGPPWYLSQQQVSLKAGDAVEVTGSKVDFNGQSHLVAREFTVNGKTVKLRDDQGTPLWPRGQGMGRQAPR